MSIKNIREIPTRSPPAAALNTGEVCKFCDCRPINRYTSRTIQDIAPQLLQKANSK